MILGPHTGLPIPAHAEMAIEGEILPDRKASEGPFGEFTGYYASGSHEEYLIKVKKVFYRNNPIICGSPPSIPPTDSTYGAARLRSALVWNAIEDCGVAGRIVAGKTRTNPSREIFRTRPTLSGGDCLRWGSSTSLKWHGGPPAESFGIRLCRWCTRGGCRGDPWSSHRASDPRACRNGHRGRNPP